MPSCSILIYFSPNVNKSSVKVIAAYLKAFPMTRLNLVPSYPGATERSMIPWVDLPLVRSRIVFWKGVPQAYILPFLLMTRLAELVAYTYEIRSNAQSG